jgi:hypothetical protein
MLEIELGDIVSNNTVEPSKDSNFPYASKMGAEQLRPAIQELNVGFRKFVLSRECEDLSYQ